jgi:hypothetical protein
MIAQFPQQDVRRLFAAHIAKRNAFILHFNGRAKP